MRSYHRPKRCHITNSSISVVLLGPHIQPSYDRQSSRHQPHSNSLEPHPERSRYRSIQPHRLPSRLSRILGLRTSAARFGVCSARSTKADGPESTHPHSVSMYCIKSIEGCSLPRMLVAPHQATAVDYPCASKPICGEDWHWRRWLWTGLSPRRMWRIPFRSDVYVEVVEKSPEEFERYEERRPRYQRTG